MPRIRSQPEDFVVEEKPLYPLAGKGAHLYLWIEKRRRTTDEVLDSLVRTLKIAPRDVGYAGRKDKLAVTRQWVSVPATAEKKLARWRLDGVRILERQRHGDKLRVGQLVGNRFELRVRDVDEAAGRQARERLETLVRRGMPNRFGRQRFGRDGRNAERGAEILRGGVRPPKPRLAWLMISALQAAVFNRVLERRAAALDELLPGEIGIVHATRELFRVEEGKDYTDRLERFEVSATGPIFGSKMMWPEGVAAELERRVMTDLGVPGGGDPRPPRGVRLYGERRPLRARVEDTSAEWRDGALELRFELPAGSYATVLLEELFPAGFDEGPE